MRSVPKLDVVGSPVSHCWNPGYRASDSRRDIPQLQQAPSKVPIWEACPITPHKR
jgi:hypothetical protein